MSCKQTISNSSLRDGELSPEDQIILQSPEKMAAIENDASYVFFSDIHADLLSKNYTPHNLDELIFKARAATYSDIKTNNLVLYTSDSRNRAEKFVSDNPDHDLIHTTPAGYWLEKLRLFEKQNNGQQLGTEATYGFWNIAAARLINETDSEHINIFANPDNRTSTLWMLELITLLERQNYTPTIDLYISNDPTPKSLTREDIQNLINPDLIEWLDLLDKNSFDTEQGDLPLHTLFNKYVKADTTLSADNKQQMREYLTARIRRQLQPSALDL